MDDIYAINLAKSEFREAYNTGDVDRLLAVYADRFTDMSVGVPSFYGGEARQVLRSRLSRLFAEYRAKLSVSIIDIQVLGATAYDYGWHEMSLTPRVGGKAIITRQRYFELWKKDTEGRWRIALYIDNMDLPPAMPNQQFVMPQTVPQEVQWT
ncbi:MAG: nuclear transport factor 2 family protein [Acidobacteria bacterium]|nr:nuclear transport factor 2 family protein [Acidobacteriota bacterium]